ncbi:MAG: pentapeptide repeat-containing protein [Caldilineales bacterium]|nr:pentapeptide repeat-containing protein [Caldilineales bacterium]
MANFANGSERFDQVFEGIRLQPQETLTGRFNDCTFIRCNFAEAILRDCRFMNCTFQDCDLSLCQIPGCSFPSTRFAQSWLIGIDWTQANWSRSALGALTGFFGCALNHSTFIGLTLKGIQFQDCVAHEVDFRDADCSQVDFDGTDLSGSLFGSTNLARADLSKARNYRIDPGNNNLKQARFSLPEAMALLYSMDIVLEE